MPDDTPPDVDPTAPALVEASIIPIVPLRLIEGAKGTPLEIRDPAASDMDRMHALYATLRAKLADLGGVEMEIAKHKDRKTELLAQAQQLQRTIREHLIAMAVRLGIDPTAPDQQWRLDLDKKQFHRIT